MVISSAFKRQPAIRIDGRTEIMVEVADLDDGLRDQQRRRPTEGSSINDRRATTSAE
jgi:hypothetical protein